MNKNLTETIKNVIKNKIKQKLNEEFNPTATAGTADIRRTGIDMGKQGRAKGVRPKERGLVDQVVKMLMASAETAEIDRSPGVRRALKLLFKELERANAKAAPAQAEPAAQEEI